MDELFPKRVTEMADELGFAAHVVDDGARIRIDVSDGTPIPIQIYVTPCGEMHGKEVLEFASRGLRLPRDDAAKMPLLILALQRNADVMLGHWGLAEETLRVFHSQIAETMDLAELKGAVLAVADEYSTLAGAFDEILERSITDG